MKTTILTVDQSGSVDLPPLKPNSIVVLVETDTTDKDAVEANVQTPAFRKGRTIRVQLASIAQSAPNTEAPRASTPSTTTVSA